MEEKQLLNDEKMIRIGIIGSNFIVSCFLEATKLCKDIEIKAIYSRNMERAEQFAKENGISLFFDDLQEFSKCSEIDAVYIASPNSCHYEQTLIMLNAGKHVLCEKPLASNLRQAQEMFQCAKDNGVLLLEAMRPIFHPAYQVIRKKIMEIGPVRQITLSYCKYSSRYNRFKQGIIENAFNPELSNGSLMDIGCYPIHVMIMLFGLPKRIMAMGVRLPKSIDGNGNLLAFYGDFLVDISYSKITDSYLRNEIQGENGTISFLDVTSPKSIQYRSGENWESVNMDAVELDMVYEIREFLREIRNMEFPHRYMDDSLDTLRVMDEARAQLGIVFPADYSESSM